MILLLTFILYNVFITVLVLSLLDLYNKYNDLIIKYDKLNKDIEFFGGGFNEK